MEISKNIIDKISIQTGIKQETIKKSMESERIKDIEKMDNILKEILGKYYNRGDTVEGIRFIESVLACVMRFIPKNMRFVFVLNTLKKTEDVEEKAEELKKILENQIP